MFFFLFFINFSYLNENNNFQEENQINIQINLIEIQEENRRRDILRDFENEKKFFFYVFYVYIFILLFFFFF